MPRRSAPIEYRFWGKLEKGEDGCWRWKGVKSDNGKGQIHSGGKYGKMLYAHIVSWTLANGPVPEGKVVSHTCDTKECVNPNHLYLAAYTDFGRGHKRKKLGQ